VSLSLTVQDPTSDRATKEQVTLPAEVFDVPTNVALIHQVVVAQQAAARAGSASTKTRGEVRGGGKKPYRQKGTGRARQGSTRAPQFAGGGVVHGPKPRVYDQRTPKKMKAAALRGALSDRARSDRLHVVSAFVTGDAPSTKTGAEALAKVTAAKNVLVVAERSDDLTWKSLRNIPTVHLLEPGQLNTYDVLISDDVVFTEGALETFLGGPLTGRSAKGAASSVEVEDDVVEVAEPTEDVPVAEPAEAEQTEADQAEADQAEADQAEAEAAQAEQAEAPQAEQAEAEAAQPEAVAEAAEPAPVKKAAAKKAPARKASAQSAPTAAADEARDDADEEQS
jgi:large subunit ribosomal protein L4